MFSGADLLRLYDLKLELSHKIYHLDRGKCTVISLISAFASGTGDCLLDVLGCQDAEEYRHLLCQSHLRDSLGDLTAHIIVVCGITADHSADADDRVVLAGLCHGRCRNRDLERPRNPGRRDIFFLHTVADKSVNCSA